MSRDVKFLNQWLYLNLNEQSGIYIVDIYLEEPTKFDIVNENNIKNKLIKEEAKKQKIMKGRLTRELKALSYYAEIC